MRFRSADRVHLLEPQEISLNDDGLTASLPREPCRRLIPRSDRHSKYVYPSSPLS